RRIVAAIFQAPEPVDENRDNFLRSDISNNSAHLFIPRGAPPPLGRRARTVVLTRIQNRTSPSADSQPLALTLSLSFFFSSTQPSILRCFPAETASAPGGTFS